MKRQEIAKLHATTSTTELAARAAEIRQKIIKALLERKLGKDKDTHKAKKLRQDLAQILTIQQEKVRQQQVKAGSKKRKNNL